MLLSLFPEIINIQLRQVKTPAGADAVLGPTFFQSPVLQAWRTAMASYSISCPPVTLQRQGDAGQQGTQRGQP